MDAREGILTEDTPHVLWVGTVADAIVQLEGQLVDVVVLQDATFLEELLPSAKGVPIVIVDEAASVADAVRYIRIGAHLQGNFRSLRAIQAANTDRSLAWIFQRGWILNLNLVQRDLKVREIVAPASRRRFYAAT